MFVPVTLRYKKSKGQESKVKKVSNFLSTSQKLYANVYFICPTHTEELLLLIYMWYFITFFLQQTAIFKYCLHMYSKKPQLKS